MLAVYEVRKEEIKKRAELHDAGNVEEAIFSLPIEERIIYILHDVDKLQNEEITLITKDSVEHINLELSRARKFLMEKLNVRRLDDLDYKVTFLPQKIEPRPELWNEIFKTISKAEPESQVPQENLGKKLRGFFKKKS